MAFLDRIKTMMSLPGAPEVALPPGPVDMWEMRLQRIQEEKLQTRAIDSFTDYPGLTEQLLRVQGLTPRPWRVASIREALGVPAIFRAVALISNTTGSLAVEAFRRGVRLEDDETPRLVQRPDPFRIPRNFYRDTAYYLASRGEFWWWVGARDSDGNALSLIVIPPWEVTVTPTNDRLRPTVKWLDREMRREDLRHGTFLPDDSGYRGVGPLQMCGAAVSVSVEAQEWAANYYATGGNPSVNLHSEVELVPDEAAELRNQWMQTPPNMPQVTSGPLSLRENPGQKNVAAAQMLDARMANNGDAARMFGMPGSLLEYASSGSSLTYQNLEGEFTKFVRACLAPDYLEPIEQELSDLLPRSTTARFNVKGFLRADIKTRFEVYSIGIDKGIMTAEMAQREEGIIAGDVEFAPVPFAPPAAVPSSLPINTRSAEPVRCDGTRLLRGVIRPCGKLLAEAGPFVGRCPRCAKQYTPVLEPLAS
jgi:HK97 family phage portal protein